MDLHIRVPGYAKSELVYTISSLMKMGFAGEEFTFSCHDFPCVEIQYGSKSIIFHQSFFDLPVMYPDQWYCCDKLPASTLSFKPKIYATELLVLYGKPVDAIEDYKYIVNADIFGSAFFMLSRWEEFVVKDRDQHQRFDAEKAMAVKHGFIRRPIVNEYAFYLRSCLEWLGIQMPAVPSGNVTLSIDIDYIYKWKSLRNLFGAWKRNLPNLNECWANLSSYIKSRSDQRCDPYFQISYMLKSLGKRQFKAVFFIKAENYNTVEDNADYLPGDRAMGPLLQEVLTSGHQIGLHPSYASFENADLICEEKKLLESAVNRKITFVRNHFLRIDLPKTYREYLRCDLIIDSSAMYTKFPGFRNGTCSSFKFFDFQKRLETPLYVVPLIAMMFEDLGNAAEKVSDDMIQLAKLAQRYGGDSMLLWHNSDLDTSDKKKAFEQLLDELSLLNG